MMKRTSFRSTMTLFRRRQSVHALEPSRLMLGHTGQRRLSTTHAAPTAHSFAMSGCGWLTPFHLGVVEQLKTEGFLVSGETIVAGTSGGALGAMAAVAGVSPEDALEALTDFGARPHLHNDIELNMRPLLNKLLTKADGTGVQAVQRCNRHLFVCVTRLWPKASFKPQLVSEFHSLPQLIDTVGASCFIPFWTAPKPFTLVGGQRLVDGGFLAFMPPIGDTRISPFPRRYIMGRRSKPDISLPFDVYSLPRLIAWAARPAPKAVLRELFVHGQEQAKAWAAQSQRSVQ